MNHVIIDTEKPYVALHYDVRNSRCALMNRGVIICTFCGERFPMPAGNCEWVCAVIKAFGKAHENCEPRVVEEKAE